MTTDENSANPVSEGEKVPMVLISIAQRNSLIEYLAKQPYQDVANGIEFLRNAPVVDVNLAVNDPGQADVGSVG